MAITCTVDAERQLVFSQGSGLLTLADLLTHLQQEEAAGGLDFPELLDLTGASTSGTAADVRVLLDRALRSSALPGPTLIVADNDAVYGMARMYGMLCDNHGIVVEVFRDRPAALARLEAWRQQHKRAVVS